MRALAKGWSDDDEGEEEEGESEDDEDEADEAEAAAALLSVHAAERPRAAANLHFRPLLKLLLAMVATARHARGGGASAR
eukprot:6169826-Prymnesium_polylepis.1